MTLWFIAAWTTMAIVAIFAPDPRTWWTALPAFAWGSAVASEVWSCASWWRAGRRASVPVAAALILAAVDAATLVHLCVGRDDWPLVRTAGYVQWVLMLGIAGTILWRK